jgi:hypothetical protein
MLAGSITIPEGVNRTSLIDRDQNRRGDASIYVCRLTLSPAASASPSLSSSIATICFSTIAESIHRLDPERTEAALRVQRDGW